jgi:hypothetical protein
MIEAVRVKDQLIDVVKVNKSEDIIVGVKGYVVAECFDANGNLRWRDEGYNAITGQNLTLTRDVMWISGSTVKDFYIGLFVSDYTPANPCTLTGDSASPSWATATFTEASWAAYARQAYVEATNGSYGVSNSASKASFTLPGTGGPWNVYGAFMHNELSANTTGDILYFVKRFTTSPRALQNSDVLEITYNITYA